MNAFKPVLKLFSPKFYADAFQGVVANTRKDFIAGSPAPLFKGMLLVGVVGYTMEYSLVGSKYQWSVITVLQAAIIILVRTHTLFKYL